MMTNEWTKSDMTWRTDGQKRTHILVWGCGAIMLAIFIAGAIFAWVQSDNSRDNLDGQWVGSGGDIVFDAEISNEQIEIWIDMDGLRGTYWVGDFVVGDEVDNGDVIISQGDTRAMEWELLASMLDEKEYIYADGNIVFEYGIMGTTQDIVLKEK